MFYLRYLTVMLTPPSISFQSPFAPTDDPTFESKTFSAPSIGPNATCLHSLCVLGLSLEVDVRTDMVFVAGVLLHHFPFQQCSCQKFARPCPVAVPPHLETKKITTPPTGGGVSPIWDGIKTRPSCPQIPMPAPTPCARTAATLPLDPPPRGCNGVGNHSYRLS